MRWICIFLLTLLVIIGLCAQDDEHCAPTISESPLSERLANYIFNINFDHELHAVSGTEKIFWKNNSPDTISFIRLYMYLNAFKGPESSYLSGANMNVMGQDLRGRATEDWGYVRVLSARQGDAEITDLLYVQPDDDNEQDESVLHIDLARAVPPGETLILDIEFVSKLPRTIARSGYADHDFNHFVHWYPKMGVYEEDKLGVWGWNCHQFLRQMEFYGDHGNYDVTIELDNKFVIGGSGCRQMYKEPVSGKSGRVETRFIAHDVIDFGWVASPNLVEYEDEWNHVEIRLLSPRSHASLTDRLLGAAKHSLQYFEDHVGTYPYKTLTILDPPLHGLRSGFMEYPTYITGGAFYSFPRGIRSMESLIVHEFAHQYFMQILANNEKEDPWLDEGFVTFYEDCVMEDMHGSSSLIDLFGYKVGNSSFTRNEYASMSNKRTSPITTVGYKFIGDYKATIYSKTATVLQTLKRYLGADQFDEMIKGYFEANKFTHPRKADFIKVVKDAFAQYPNTLSSSIDQFLVDALDESKIVDYSVIDVGSTPTGDQDDSGNTLYHNWSNLERKGDFIVPVELRLYWTDGTTTDQVWDGIDPIHGVYELSTKQLRSLEIDPERKLFLDIDFNNNSYTLDPDNGGIWKYATRSIYWVQNIIQSASFLM